MRILNLFEVTNLVTNESVGELLGDLHEFGAGSLLYLGLSQILAASYDQFCVEDTLLSRRVKELDDLLATRSIHGRLSLTKVT